MPAPYVKKLSKKHGVSPSTGERKWDDAKDAAGKQGQSDNYAYRTAIFKKMMHEKSDTSEGMAMSDIGTRVVNRIQATAFLEKAEKDNPDKPVTKIPPHVSQNQKEDIDDRYTAGKKPKETAASLNDLSYSMQQGYTKKLDVLQRDFGPLKLVKLDQTVRTVNKSLKDGTNYRSGFDNDEPEGKVRNLVFTLKSPQGGTLTLERREGATQASDYWRVSVNGSKPVTLPGMYYDALVKGMKSKR